MALRELPRVVRLDLGHVQLPSSHPAGAGQVPVYGFCVLHPAGAILVDTGVGFGNDFIDRLYQPVRVVLSQALEAVGVELSAVTAVVNSHLHFDHCGQNPALFDGPAAFYVQTTEFQAVERDPHYTDVNWASAPAHKRHDVDGDGLIAEGVTLLATPGHTHGHQSVLVEGGGRRVVIGAQLVWGTSEYGDELASAANVDPDPALQTAAVESIRRIKALRPEVVYFSHCSEVRGAASIT